MTTIMIFVGAFVGVYLVVGLAHASAIQSDNLLRPGRFLVLVLCWPFKGRSLL